ncbi:hypothetical protein Vadar_025625 [Vaccinium darrowii]|uniref:Uncharacterized protein n=1 Tax=Vaccinium darrowii TaxID=229202 RepID=A0ACB7XT34_9ERIC|nr:hypothetical protein Vadar_025625 [Vaccinium darrowii]
MSKNCGYAIIGAVNYRKGSALLCLIKPYLHSSTIGSQVQFHSHPQIGSNDVERAQDSLNRMTQMRPSPHIDRFNELLTIIAKNGDYTTTLSFSKVAVPGDPEETEEKRKRGVRSCDSIAPLHIVFEALFTHEGHVGEGEAVLVRVEEGEAAVVFLDELEVLGVVVVVDLEEGVVVGMVNAFLGGNEDVNDGEDLVEAVKQRVGFSAMPRTVPMCSIFLPKRVLMCSMSSFWCAHVPR